MACRNAPYHRHHGGLIVFAVTFTYTGNADMLAAITAGPATGLLIYLTVHIFRDKSGEK